MEPTTQIDSRFSDPEAGPTPWPDAARVLEEAEISWLTTVRADGRPHVTPLPPLALFVDGVAYFTTGPDQQKAPSLARVHAQCVLTTGCNHLREGLDLVVEGAAERRAGRRPTRAARRRLRGQVRQRVALRLRDGLFVTEGHEAAVFRIEPSKVLAFAKEPHAQTRYRFLGHPRP